MQLSVPLLFSRSGREKFHAWSNIKKTAENDRTPHKHTSTTISTKKIVQHTQPPLQRSGVHVYPAGHHTHPPPAAATTFVTMIGSFKKQPTQRLPPKKASEEFKRAHAVVLKRRTIRVEAVCVAVVLLLGSQISTARFGPGQ